MSMKAVETMQYVREHCVEEIVDIRWERGIMLGSYASEPALIRACTIHTPLRANGP